MEWLGGHVVSSHSVAYISFSVYLLFIIHCLSSYSSNLRREKKKGVTSKTSGSLEGLEGVCSMIVYTLLHRLIELPSSEETFKVTLTAIHLALPL